MCMDSHKSRFVTNPSFDSWSQTLVTQEQIIQTLTKRLDYFSSTVPIPCRLAISSNKKQDYQGFDMFEGPGGYLYLYLKFYRFLKQTKPQIVQSLIQFCNKISSRLKTFTNQESILSSAISQYNELISAIKSNTSKNVKITFFFSKYSIYLCGAHLCFITNDSKGFKNNINLLLQGYDIIIENHQHMLCEILYGIPGYLIMLLELQSSNGEQSINKVYHVDFSKQIQSLVRIIIARGIQNYQKLSGIEVNFNLQLPKNFRLVYYFYEQEYIGGAHGLAGVLNVLFLSYQLLHTQEFSKQTCHLIQVSCLKSIQFLLTQMVDNNFDACVSNKPVHSQYTQFCHGNPGILTPLLHFCELFPNQSKSLRIQQVVIRNMNKIWEQGLLKKGYWGLCHGISGNAYAFISPVFHRVFPQKAQQFLKKAQLFWVLQEDKEIQNKIKSFQFNDRMMKGTSDFPYSLMLGTAGDICFALDLLNRQGVFPGFDL